MLCLYSVTNIFIFAKITQFLPNLNESILQGITEYGNFPFYISELVARFLVKEGYCSSGFEDVDVSTIDECMLECYNADADCAAFVFHPVLEYPCRKYSTVCPTFDGSSLVYYRKLSGVFTVYITFYTYKKELNHKK